MDLNSKVAAALGRISEVFKVLLWDHAKRLKLSPIQIQILNFIASHKEELCTISAIAKEFNVTKPTISDAIRVLENKEMIVKNSSPVDSRSYTMLLSPTGNQIVAETENFADPLKKMLSNTEDEDLELVFETLNKLIFQLNRKGVLTVQRICYGCKFYEKKGTNQYCNLLEKELLNRDIRLDCPEHVTNVPLI